MRYRRQRNWGCRIHITSVAGIDAVALENDRIRVTVLHGKGGDVVEFNVKRHDLDIVWLSPRGVRDPHDFLSTSADPLATFVDHYPGGWQDVFPNAGAPASWAGAHYGQHGEISTMPWDLTVETDTEDEVAIRLTVEGRKIPSRIERVMRLQRGRAELVIEESATNLSRQPVRAMWGQHITFGAPYLAPGSVITLPEGVTGIAHESDVGATGRRVESGARFTWPIAPGVDGGDLDLSVVPPRDTPSDLVYLTGFPEPRAWYELRNPAQPFGVRVEWDRDPLPYLWYWQEFGGTTGYPWYGEVNVIGLEPNSSFPTNGLPDAVANGSALTIEPGGRVSFTLAVAILEETGNG